MKRLLIFITLLLYGIITVSQVTSNNYLNLNKPERLDWFKKQGFGMFIHFSFDSQLGVVISHSMAGASSDYLDRFVNDLPKTFNPENFAPEEIATIAKLAGMKYIVFTTKHHSGFCMWNTQTTGFNIMNTPYGKDLLAEYVDATRKAGLAVGFYYSPEDFNFLYENGLQVRRRFTVPIPGNIMDKYLELVELQCIELMARFGKIDIIFFDGGEGLLQEKCKEVVWNMQPDIVVTRGAMQTPEQTILGITSEEPWESCITMGTQWAYKPTNEKYKTGTRLIEILIETRAKGGNLLLNTGPKPDGELPEEQEALLREMAAWNFINYEAVEDIKPWILPNEDDIWFTWRPEKKTLYAFLTNIPEWTRGERKEFVIKSAKITEDATVDVLGQSSELVEYQPSADAKTYFEQTGNGLKISCVRAQRIYNNHRWHNPLVIKITGVSPALDPPVVKTNNAEITGRAYNELMFNGEVIKTGDAEILIAGFQFRIFTGAIEELSSSKWEETNTTEISGTGE
ncbi:MAG: alpha-L-fucosidase, partial [Prolixibacteraceae bacterium]|nr:alpha-L-fucosidase [Prolixibacteraceae bacterium]